MHTSDDKPEYQAISYSNDGESFHFYENNPVLDIGSNSFRDPQVFWFAPKSEWIMIVTRPHLHKVSFYSSQNLKQWTWLSDFGPMGAHSNDWEVPDIFQLPVDGKEANKKWVLSIGQGPNKMQYFLGDFDGTRFIPDEQTVHQNQKPEPFLWADYGTDFYAARSWRNIDNPDSKRTTWLAWMGNWSYARDVPTSWGKGFECLPRDLSLKTFSEGVRLVQQPVPELKMLRTDSLIEAGKTITGVQSFPAFKSFENSYEMEATIEIDNAVVAGVNLMVGDGRKLIVGYDTEKEQLFIDRTNCTDVSDSNFLKPFAVKMDAPLHLVKKILKLQIFVDRSSVEVFANDGERVISATTFQSGKQTGVEFFASGGSSNLINLKAWKLKSIR
jgi:fructan beta-fructosidase